MRFFIYRVSVALTALLICFGTLTACQKEMPKRLDGMYSSDTSSEGANTDSGAESDTENTESTASKDTDDTAGEEKIAVPPFKAGSYVMDSSTSYEQMYYQGKSIVSRVSTTQTYTYGIKLSVKDSGAMTAVYTFQRIQTGYEGSQSYTMDTDDKSGRDEDTAVYYDLIGQSFTVNITPDFALTVKGVDKIHKNYPDTAELIDDDNMREVASDLFYRIEGPLSVGSAWQLNQSGIVNTYSVTKLNDKNMLVNIAGGKLDVPAPFTREEITYTYQACNALKGSLVITRDNRMVQEQSSYQSNTGTIEYSGTTYSFEETSSSLCTITKA